MLPKTKNSSIRIAKPPATHVNAGFSFLISFKDWLPGSVDSGGVTDKESVFNGFVTGTSKVGSDYL